MILDNFLDRLDEKKMEINEVLQFLKFTLNTNSGYRVSI